MVLFLCKYGSVVITLLNQKGGTGKSTLAYLLACALKNAKIEVALRDLDSQGTVRKAVQRLGEIPMADEAPTQVVIQDTPGRLPLDSPTELASAAKLIQCSDRVLLISELSIHSVEASGPAALFVNTHLPKTAKAFVVWNKVRTTTKTGRQDRDALASMLGLKSAQNWIPLASCYEEVLIDGYQKAMKNKRQFKQAIESLALEILT